MAVHESLPTPYHQQDTDVYCGAACAQIVLEAIGAGIQSQDGVYIDERNHTSELASWYNPPDGLQWVLNDRRPAGFGGWFALYSLATEDAISRKLCWTVHHYKVPAVAMVYGGDHWVVVRGFQASAAPTDSNDTSYTIDAFDVNNPWPPAPSFYASPTPAPGPPPPHSGTDGCGTGGMRGVANEHIAYSQWKSTYATGNQWGSLWKNRYVAVCDPDPPPTRPGAQAPGADRPPADELLDPETAVERALDGLRRYGLFERDDWGLALRDTEPGPPVLVQRLDQNDGYYFIVPLNRGGEGVTAAVAVDGRVGDYRQAIAVPLGGSSILTGLGSEAVLERTVGQTLQLPGRAGRLTVRPEAYALYPTLVWRPCRESLSPFMPFHLVVTGQHHIFVRLDGRVFTKLHLNTPGI